MLASPVLQHLSADRNVIEIEATIQYRIAEPKAFLFHAHDPEHWRTLGISLLTLFRVVTLEDWTDHLVPVGQVIAYVRQVRAAVSQPVTVANS